MKLLTCFTLLALSFLSGCLRDDHPPMSFPPETGAIEVLVTGFRDSDGVLLLSLFGSPEGFPGKTEKAVRNLSASVENRTARVLIEGVPFGEYALSALHDENGDGSMNTSLFGIPTEGYAVSNNPGTHFGAPDFEEASFFLLKGRIEQHLEINYPGPKGPPW